jgi:hypothetical protein
MSEEGSAAEGVPELTTDLPAGLSGFDPVAIDRIEREERAARLKLAAIEAGRRKGGLVGAAMAGSMLALQEIYEGPPHDADIVEVAESPDEPGDIDKDGIMMTVGDVDVWAPPPAGSDGTDDVGRGGLV